MTSNQSHEEELWEAALNDNANAIYISKADINAKTPLGNTALHIAASGGCLNAVKALLEKGAEIDCRDKGGLTSLFKAVQENNVHLAEYLMAYGASTAITDETQMTLLHWAAKNGMTTVAQRLLSDKGLEDANQVNVKEESGKTPLHFASKEGHLSTVRLLLSFTENPSPKDDIQWTPLHEAAFWDHLPVVRTLLEAVKGGKGEIAHYLLIYGPDMSVVDILDESTLLHHAAQNGMADLIKQLLEFGKVDPLARDCTGRLPLHLACEGGNAATVNLLLNCGIYHIDVIEEESQWTPLHEAAFWGHKSVVKLLLDNEAAINPKTIVKETPLRLAYICGNTYVAELIRSKGGILEDVTPIQ